MDSDFQISLLVARESKMNDFWQNFVERHQMTVLIWFPQYTHKMTLQFQWCKIFASVATVTWMVGSSKFWYQYDRIYVVFHRMDSDFQISLLVAREQN